MTVAESSARPARPELRAETACALCGRREYSVVGRRDRDGRPLRTVMCDSCGLVWTNPRPSDDEIDRYYARHYRLDYARQLAPSPRKLLRGFFGAEERRQALAHLLSTGTRVLDVGCGAGEFVFLLRQHGLEATGIEPGEEFAEFSRIALRAPIQTATVDTATVAPRSQDVVTMFHMLEHVADPRHVLAAVRAWLREAGTLVVEVPNVVSTAQAPRHRFHFAHLYNFSSATLAALGESVGLAVADCHETADGGNVICEFRRTEVLHAVTALPQNVARTRALFEAHTSFRHYLTATPYNRVASRLGRRWQEDRLLGRLPTLEALVEWAAAGGPDLTGATRSG